MTKNSTQIKLIVTDMDGTFLNDNHEIDSEFWDILNLLENKSVKFSVASGRQYFNLLEKFSRKKDDIIFIAENGTIVIHDGKELFSNCLNKEDVDYFLKKIENIKNIGTVLCGKEQAYIVKDSPDFIEEVEKYYEKYSIVKNFADVKEEILKIAIYDYIDSHTNTFPHFAEDLERCKIVTSGKHWVDIFDKNANKGVALKFVQKHFDISYESTVVFGDYLNDLEMLEEAYFSFAMKNGHELLKEKARFITEKDNNESGVVYELKKMLNNY